MSSQPAGERNETQERERGTWPENEPGNVKSLLREESGKAYDRKMVGHEEGSGKERII